MCAYADEHVSRDCLPIDAEWFYSPRWLELIKKKLSAAIYKKIQVHSFPRRRRRRKRCFSVAAEILQQAENFPVIDTLPLSDPHQESDIERSNYLLIFNLSI